MMTVAVFPASSLPRIFFHLSRETKQMLWKLCHLLSHFSLVIFLEFKRSTDPGVPRLTMLSLFGGINDHLNLEEVNE